MAPANTPAPVLAKLEDEITAILKMPEVQKRFSELGAELFVLFQSPAQAVQSFGDDFTGKTGNIHRPLVDFDARHDAFFGKQLRKWRAIAHRRADRLVEQDYAADRFFDTFGGKKHFAVGAAVVVVGFYFDAVKSPFDGAHTLIGSQNPFAFGHHRLSDRFEFLFRHGVHSSLCCTPPYLHSTHSLASFSGAAIVSPIVL